MSNPQLQEMLDNAVHFGRKTHRWNPKIKPYLYGQNQGVHIFDLKKTAECLSKALKFIEENLANRKKILVVSTKPQTLPLVPPRCEELNLPYVVHKWFGGLLTNFSTIKSRIRYLKKMKELTSSGEIKRYTKNEQTRIRKEIGKLQQILGGIENMTDLPDLLFVTDVERDHIAVAEATKLGIPVIGLCDSNANPEIITYPIPCNVRSVKSLGYMLDKFFLAVKSGQSKKPTPQKNNNNHSQPRSEKLKQTTAPDPKTTTKEAKPAPTPATT